MKQILIFLIYFFSLNIFSQNSFIVDKKGTKTFVRDDATEIIVVDKRISYVNVGKSWEKYIKFDDLDFAVIGSSLLKSFNLNQSKKSSVYFVLAEKQDMKLIGLTVTVTTTQGNSTWSTTYYELYVVDNNNKILEGLNMTGGDMNKSIIERAKIAPMIKKYFSDCPKVITKLNKYDVVDEKNRSILEFLSDTEYINCK